MPSPEDLHSGIDFSRKGEGLFEQLAELFDN